MRIFLAACIALLGVFAVPQIVVKTQSGSYEPCILPFCAK